MTSQGSSRSSMEAHLSTVLWLRTTARSRFMSRHQLPP